MSNRNKGKAPRVLRPNEIVKYGLVWDTDRYSDPEIELYCYRVNRTVEQGGLGKFGHFKNFVDMTWNDPIISPNISFVWNEWSERMVRSYCEEKLTAWAGAASAGKSACAAVCAIVEYLADPMHTLVIVTSTTLTGARQRIWKSIDQYWGAIEGLPGNMVASLGRIKGMNLDGVSFGDATGIFLLASEKKKEKDALGKLIGIKATDRRRTLPDGTEEVTPGKLVLIADELPELPESLVHAAFSNLWANEGFKMVALGNPASHFDAFGIVCKPIGGWDSITEDDHEWRTERGVCLRFDGTISPRITGDTRCTWMLSQEQIDLLIRDYGEKSVYYFRMVKAFWAPQGVEETIYTSVDIIEHGSKKAVFGLEAPIRVAGMDPSFSFKGDRTVVQFGTYGKRPDGTAVLQFDERVILQEDLTKTRQGITRSEQLIKQFRDACESRGVSPLHAAFDATGAHGFSDMVSVLWSTKVLRVHFSGRPTNKPVSPMDKAPAHERFTNHMSEIWAVGASLLRAGQLCGIDDALAFEMCSRTYEVEKVSGFTRIKMESKDSFKGRMGASPDLADAAFVLVDLCRTRFGFRSSEKFSEGVEFRDEDGTLVETKSAWQRFYEATNKPGMYTDVW